MAPIKTVKTYDRRFKNQTISTSKSEDAVNALFAQNITKRMIGRRRKPKYLNLIKDLPTRAEAFLSDDSLTVKKENPDPFDQVLKGKVYNPVKITTKKFVPIISSESETSKSKSNIIQTTSIHSPIWTRTRRRKKSTPKITPADTASLEISSRRGKQDSTLDQPITESLCIEKVTKKLNFASLNYINLTTFKDNEVSEHNNESLFRDTFRERQPLFSSTPLVAPASSPLPDSSKLIEKSYDEIRKWDSSFPVGATPLRSEASKQAKVNNLRRRKLSTAIGELRSTPPDWKLKARVKVWLKPVDIIDSDAVQAKLADQAEFRGFSEEDQSHSDDILNRTNRLFDEVDDFRGFTREDQSRFDEILNETREFFSKVQVSLNESRTRFDETNKTTDKREVSLNQSKTEFDETNETKSQTEFDETNETKSQTEFDEINKTTNKPKINKRRSSKDLKRQSMIASRTRSKNNNIKPKPILETHKEINHVTVRGRHVNSTRERNKTKALTNKTSDLDLEPVTNTRRRYGQKPLADSTSSDLSTRPVEKARPSRKRAVSTRGRHKFRKSPSVLSSSRSPAEKARPSTRGRNKSKKSPTPSTDSSITQSRTVSLEEFESFVSSFMSRTSSEDSDYSESKITKQSPTPSEDSYACSESQIKKQKTPTTYSAEDLAEDVEMCLPDIKGSPTPAAMRSANDLNFLIPGRNTNNGSSSKIIVLSNISLGFSMAYNDLNRTCEDIVHDHSYCDLPALTRYSTPKRHDPTAVSTDISDIIESSMLAPGGGGDGSRATGLVNFQAGKKYRRSVLMLRRSSAVFGEGRRRSCAADCICPKCLFLSKHSGRRSSVKIVPASPEKRRNESLLESYARKSLSYVQEQESSVENSLDESIKNLSIKSARSLPEAQDHLPPVTAKEIVLRRCGQAEVLAWEECYSSSTLRNCQKIGEGLYGEVFLYRNQNGGTTVMKVIPVEGALIVNDEKQKKFEEIMSEIVISMELSNLRDNLKNQTSCFCELQKVRCTRGKYPDRLLKLWELYEETKGTENDSPEIFSSDQAYIVLELANGGQDLESFVFNNARQAYSVFVQIACALAVAENELKFEHRDLHWGNVLISRVKSGKKLKFLLDGHEIVLDSQGVEATIIDFTLSRFEFDGAISFNDLQYEKELFLGKGDYQFDIYRLMQRKNGNEWGHFEPYTNILWLHYILDKAVTSDVNSPTFHYQYPNTKVHNVYLEKLEKFKSEVLNYNSAVDFVQQNFL